MSAELEMVDWGNRVRNLPCWSVVAASVGSCFSMSFGSKVPRPKPLRNAHLTSDEQNYDGQYGLFVTTSPWCLFCDEKKIVDWTEDGSPNGPVDRGLSQLRDTGVSSVIFDPTTGNLELQFHPGSFVLLIIAENLDPGDDGYCVFFPDRTVSLFANGSCEIKPQPVVAQPE